MILKQELFMNEPKDTIETNYLAQLYRDDDSGKMEKMHLRVLKNEHVCSCGCMGDVYHLCSWNEKQEDYDSLSCEVFPPSKETLEKLSLSESDSLEVMKRWEEEFRKNYDVEKWWNDHLNEFIKDGWQTEPPEPIELFSVADSLVSSEEERKKALQRLINN